MSALPSHFVQMVAQPIVLLISSGWHTPQSYIALTSALTSTDLEIQVPALGSISDSRSPTSGLSIDTSPVRSYAQSLIDVGNHIVVLMHSYDGQVGTNALSGLGVRTRSADELLAGGVTHLVYKVATAVAEGIRMVVDTVRDFGHEELLPLAFFEIADGMSCVHRDQKLLMIWG